MIDDKAGNRGLCHGDCCRDFGFKERRPDILSGTPRAHAIDRWIFVFMAAWFIAIVLAGFIPDSMVKVARCRPGNGRRSRWCCTCMRC